MALKLFDFVEDTISLLENRGEIFEKASENIEIYFKNILQESSEGYLNINARVKSSISLKEKILRNNYYRKYNNSEELLDNLSDLIGIRIECRFIQDENEIYKAIKKHFNVEGHNGFYYNVSNDRISLKLQGKQPQKQRNGFEIYRIDGVYLFEDIKINFELQIKSLVNIFWGEIEHKVTYKNYNYLLGDKFFKDMLASIKRNLTMIDNQLLIMYNQFNTMNSIDQQARKNQFEGVMSKIIYEIYSNRVRDSLGFIVDFRRSCDVVMEYIFSTNKVEDIEDYSKTLIKTLNRFNSISKNHIDFNEEINFEREINFKGEFSELVGKTILKSINTDFQWNLFFKILFDIEVGNNAEDFEAFIEFLRNKFLGIKVFNNLYVKYDEEQCNYIVQCFVEQLANCFVQINSIDFIHKSSMERINEILEEIILEILKEYNCFDEFKDNRVKYTELFKEKLMEEFI